jgi:hypothetical protein
MKNNLYHGDTFGHEGLTFRVEFEDDTDSGPPWEECDGHGVVSDWTRRDKCPGERVLCSDRGSKRYYDVQASTAIAKRDGWGLCDEHKAELLERLCRPRYRWEWTSSTSPSGVETRWQVKVQIPGRDPARLPLTAGEIREEAVRRDYEFLRGWCNDDWRYVGVIVTLMVEDEDGQLVESDPALQDSLWRVETWDDYHMEVAIECAANVAAMKRDSDNAAAKEQAEAQYWGERDVITL